MNDVFREQYAADYDLVYRNKNYASECDAVGKLIERFGDGKIRSLLDLGCGTGRHAVHLTRQGFDVTGVDFSEAMLVHARNRAKSEKLDNKIALAHGDIRGFSSGRQFDSVLMNFNVLGYMLSNDDVLGALQTARRNVRDNGLFIADFWYGPAVVADPPRQDTREIDVPTGRIVRSSSGRHLPHQQSCEIAITVTHLEKGRVISKTEEIHRVRYFFPLELELMLRISGFRLFGLTDFPDVERPASDRNWVAALVAMSI